MATCRRVVLLVRGSLLTDDTNSATLTIAMQYAKSLISQTTLPRRGSSHSFYLQNLQINKELGGSFTAAAYPLTEQVLYKYILRSTSFKLLTLLKV